jgi:alkane 1-monooxygenase
MAGVTGLAGHELIHKRPSVHKYFGTYTFAKIMYSHFLLEHNSGHHRNVATELDPATAVKGEIFYTFMVRSVFGGHYNTWKREV